MKIFIVDDDPDMLQIMEALLGQAGHEVAGCMAASFGLPMIADRRPDLVLTDLVMAEVDGLELISEIKGRKDLKGTRVVMVSGKGGEHWKSEAFKRGAVGYITKPIDPETFVATVEQLGK